MCERVGEQSLTWLCWYVSGRCDERQLPCGTTQPAGRRTGDVRHLRRMARVLLQSGGCKSFPRDCALSQAR